MGQGGKVAIINNTDSRMIKKYEHSYQMESWKFPDVIEPGHTALDYVEWCENYFKEKGDDAGDIHYYLEKDKNKTIELRMWDAYFHQFTGAVKGYESINSEPTRMPWYHNGVMAISVCNLKRWMEHIDDNTPINKMSIPGTHDSLTFNLITSVEPTKLKSQTQTLSIEQQLERGCRFFDLRFNNRLEGRHEWIDCRYGLNDAMEWFAKFLNQNSTEAIFVRMKIEGDNDENKNTDDETYKNMMKNVYEKYKNILWSNENGSGFPVLGKLRGKIVILDELDDKFFYKIGIGFDYESAMFTIQDLWNGPQEDEKYKGIINNIKEPYNSSKMKINFVSANSQKIPYFGWDPEKYSNYLTPKVMQVVTKEAVENHYVLGFLIFDFFDYSHAYGIIANNTSVY